ncbi:unnamed protein product [Clavelina lepadiformis]|uniref:Aspartyl/asparaginy/proline hydroxylase domain-containing protein n=1 Tax=Clavelina lepadiformis TaxID=159417 RepID=A0ABP0FU77_CLALP
MDCTHSELHSSIQKQQTNGNEKANLKSRSVSRGSHGILIILFMMVAITWGIAASAYFGLVDYKALIVHGTSVSTSDIMQYTSALYPSQYEALRHPVRSLGEALIYFDDLIFSLFVKKEKTSYIDKRRVVVFNFPLEKHVNSIKDSSQLYEKTSANAVSNDDSAKDSGFSKDHTNDKKISGEPTDHVDGEASTKEEQPQAESKMKPTQEKNKKKSSQAKTSSSSLKAKSGSSNQLSLEQNKTLLKQLQEGDELLKKKKVNEALSVFEKIISSNPSSPSAIFGKAEALNQKSLQQRSNKILIESLKFYDQVINLPNCPKKLKKKAGLIKAERHIFLGQLKEAVITLKKMAETFPRDTDILNQLGVSYLYVGNTEKAQKVYAKVLSIDPDNGFAQVHFGFILKTAGDWIKGAYYLKLGIESMAEGTQEGKFYFHLGDALHRTNRSTEADEIYKLGAKNGLFKSKYQRSLYNVNRLQSHPFWTPAEAKVNNYVKTLESKWKMIRDEALNVMDVEKGLFISEEESLKDTGDWKQLTLYARGQPQKDCKRLPKTCALVSKMPNAHGCTRGQIKFSIMMPGTHVWPHTGPTNCRLRMHLGLVIPKTGQGAWLRCADQNRTWEEGKVLIFDDSFEHEVWQNAESFRLILIVDVWHPDITEHEKKTLSPI